VAVIEVLEAYLVHTALDERGDMVVIAADGSQLDYREFKKRTGGMRLAFPSHDVVRATPDFQIWSFQRTENNSSVWLCRSMISGKSGDSRPMPIFEVYLLQGAIASESSFLESVSNLSFPAYPPAPEQGCTGVRKPSTWISVSDRLGSSPRGNPKPKGWKQVSSVSDWNKECRDCVDKLLWFICHGKQYKTGISLCFTADAFRTYDVCTYYYTGRKNAAILKHQACPDKTRLFIVAIILALAFPILRAIYRACVCFCQRSSSFH